MKRPSFQFYPGDWMANSNLRRCTDAEQGVWMRVLCVLHDQDEYGIVRWPLKDLAQAANCTVAILKSLVKKGVLKGADGSEQVEKFVYVPRSGRKDGDPVTLVPSQEGPVWYSSRFVKDEYVRTIRGAGTRFGDGDGEALKDAPNESPNTTPKASPKPPIGEGQGDGPSSSSSSSPSVNYYSVLRTDASAPSNPTDEPEPSEKAQLWAKVKAMLMADGLTKAQAGTFVGGLVKDHGESVALEAMRIAVTGEPPADARSYLTATCQHVAGERTSKVPGWWTSDDLAKKQAAIVGVGGPRVGESTDMWHARIRAAIDNGGKPVAASVAAPEPMPVEPEAPKAEATPEQIAARRSALLGSLKGRSAPAFLGDAVAAATGEQQ